MTPHLPPLTLESAAEGFALPAEATRHLVECPQCQRRRDALFRASEALRASPQFLQHKRSAVAVATRSETRVAPWRSWLRGLAFAIPVAAAAALTLMVRPHLRSGEERLKGSSVMEVIRVATGEPTRLVHVGEPVALELKGGNHPYVLVFAVSERGEVSLAWPSVGVQSAPAPTGGRAPAFRVTAGSFSLHGFFSDAPLPVSAAQTALQTLETQCHELGKPAECQPLPNLPGEQSHRRLAVTVRP